MFTLVQCPIIGESISDLAPPLGLLRLCQAINAPTSIVDLNLLWHSEGNEWRERWPESAVDRILRGEPKVIGFTSMAIETHVALDLAWRIKTRCPEVFIIVGGPHMGQIPEFLLEQASYIDAVVIGEGESAIEPLYKLIVFDERQQIIPGTCVRNEGRIVKTPPVGSIDLNLLGLVKYDYVDIESYFSLNKIRLVNIEFGRGCKYDCSFCYSKSHFIGKARDIEPKKAADILQQAEEIGAKHAFVVGDNLLNDQAWAINVCDEIASRELEITWTCYSTIQDISAHVAMALSQAGCRLIYIGIDAVETNQQKSLKKKFFHKWKSAVDNLQHLKESGIVTECAFLLEGLSEKRFQTEMNIHAALDVTARKLGVPRLNMLTAYSGTKIKKKTNEGVVASRLKIDFLQDVPEPVLANHLAEKHPGLFPFHSIQKDPKCGESLVLLIADTTFILWFFPRTMLALLHQLMNQRRSKTPFQDWWEENILIEMDSDCKSPNREKRLRRVLQNWSAGNGSLDMKVWQEIEEANYVLMETEQSGKTVLLVEEKHVTVFQRPSIALERLENYGPIAGVSALIQRESLRRMKEPRPSVERVWRLVGGVSESAEPEAPFLVLLDAEVARCYLDAGGVGILRNYTKLDEKDLEELISVEILDRLP